MELLKPMNRASVSEMIIERITDEIISGKLKPGDKIPTEMELSQALGVGRNSVREATKILEAFGVLEVRRAEGTFVVDRFTQGMLNPVMYGVILNASSMEMELFKVAAYRSMLYMILQNITDDKIEKLRISCEHIKEVVLAHPNDVDAIYEANVAFHSCLASLSGNTLMNEFMNVVIRISKFHRIRSITNTIELGDPMLNYTLSYMFVEFLEKKDRTLLDPFMDEVSKSWVGLVFPEEK